MVLRKSGLFGGIAAVVLALLIAGCGGNSSLGPSANSNSRVRVFNALQGSPGTGAIDVLQSNNSVNLNPGGSVNYGVASPYVLIRSGNGINTNVYQTGTTTNPLAPQVSIDLTPHDTGSNNGTYTVVVAGVAGQNAGNTTPQIIRLIDNPATPAAGQALIRFVNLSPDAGNVTLFNTSGNPPVAVAIPGQPGNGIAYNVTTDYLTVTPVNGQAFNLGVFTGGQSLTLPNNAGTVTLTAGKAYTIYLIGEVTPANGGQPLNLIVAEDALSD